MKTTLTPEESASLIELGVDKSKASERTTIIEGAGFDKWVSDAPLFTLTDLMELLPKGIIHNGLSCKFRITSWYDEPYFAGYDKQHVGYVCIFDAPELIDALHSLLVWALEKGYVNLKDEQV